jgi:16S rRNA C967 or C1407 C5-methylase (RsmB/RsmF family)
MRTELPKAFIDAMRRDMGEAEAERLFLALDTEPLTSIRLNPFKMASTYDGEVVGWSPLGRYLNERPQFTLDPLLHGGAYYVQEASSQFVAHLLKGENIEGGRVLDMCAAPGGKTTI